MERTRKRGALSFAALALLVCAISIEGGAQNRAAAANTAPSSISVTLYITGSSLVRESFHTALPSGIANVKIPGIALQLVPGSVRVLTPNSAGLLSASYSYPTLNQYDLLRAYVGKQVTIIETHLKDGSEIVQPVRATLLAASPGPVWQIDGKIETGLKSKHYIFPSLPKGLSASRTLVLRLKSEQAGEAPLALSYLTNGLNWSANYVLSLDQNGTSGTLAARALIRNTSGESYPNAEVQLVAGEVQRVNEGAGFAGGMMAGAPRPRFAMEAAPVVTQQPFAGYHLYTVKPRLDIHNETSQQVALLPAAQIHLTRFYDVTGHVYSNQAPEISGPQKTPVTLRLKFQNSKSDSLGEPLPGGIVRVYQNDESGLSQLVGEDTFQGTAAGEAVTLTLGNAFDVIAESKQTEYRKLSPTSAEASYELALRNHQAQPVTVTATEQFNGEWQMVDSSLPYTKTDSSTAKFEVPVPAHGQTTLKYEVRMEWTR